MKKIQEEALNRIKRLFNQAKKEPKMSKRYIELAKKTAMKVNIKIPRAFKHEYCKKCLSFFDSKNSKIRIKKDMKIIKCLKCSNYNRIKIK